MYNVLHPSFYPCFCQPKYIWQGVQIIKLLFSYSYYTPPSYCFFLRGYKYLPQHRVFEHPKPCCSHVRTTVPYIYIYTYLLTQWSRVLFEKLTGLQLVKKFPACYGTWRFITSFTSVRHLSLSWASLIQSKPSHPTSWRSILILSSHLRLGLPSGLSLRFPHQNPVQATLPHTRYMVRSSHSRFYYPHIIGWGIQIIQLLVM